MRAVSDNAASGGGGVSIKVNLGLLPQYRIVREIGRGEYGVVSLARRQGAFFAVKTVRRTSGPGVAGGDPYERELRGVRLVSRLPRIEGLVRIHDLAEAPDGSAFAFAMDLADPEREEAGPMDAGYRPRTLASVIDAEIALPLDECLAIAVRVAGALVQLQRYHVIHRDIKPGNIVFIGGKAVLADIGLVVDAREASSIVGTPGYAPPERLGSAAGDVFGLGKTLYRISTGRLPAEEGLPPCVEADIDAPFFWKWMLILSKATARDPALRYRSAKGFLRDLRRLRRLVSLRSRTAWRIGAALVAVFAFVFAFPALWNHSRFVLWTMMTQEMRDHFPLPYPYSLFRPFLVSKDAPPRPDRKIPSIERALKDVNKAVDDVVRDVSGDERRVNERAKRRAQADARKNRGDK